MTVSRDDGNYVFLAAFFPSIKYLCPECCLESGNPAAQRVSEPGTICRQIKGPDTAVVIDGLEGLTRLCGCTIRLKFPK